MGGAAMESSQSAERRSMNSDGLTIAW
jgi:hypothetical protein